MRVASVLEGVRLALGERRWFRAVRVEGVYVWGGVGRGKTMLMDRFYRRVEGTTKRRVHFHAFMQEVHQRLAVLRAQQTQDPVIPLGVQLAQETRLVCFDEFQVNDIADASILGRLFTAMFAAGAVVVATSNLHPDNLYEGGLNRHRLLPFLALLQKQMQVIALDGERDYRLGATAQGLWHQGHGARRAMDRLFGALAGANPASQTLTVQARALCVPAAGEGVARITFAGLCGAPLGTADYAMLADTYHTLMIDTIPRLTRSKRNEIQRFINLIDVLYEKGTRLIVSASHPPDALCPRPPPAFARTVSRLHAMTALAVC